VIPLLQKQPTLAFVLNCAQYPSELYIFKEVSESVISLWQAQLEKYGLITQTSEQFDIHI